MIATQTLTVRWSTDRFRRRARIAAIVAAIIAAILLTFGAASATVGLMGELLVAEDCSCDPGDSSTSITADPPATVLPNTGSGGLLGLDIPQALSLPLAALIVGVAMVLTGSLGVVIERRRVEA